ncbi:hypothetical protein B0H14DRAFT_2587966 [Mycena olivaceomarginata]|nr:hypothetical protein B0H14DRAFT_2587966 [Mycena olivaceomarginata]
MPPHRDPGSGASQISGSASSHASKACKAFGKVKKAAKKVATTIEKAFDPPTWGTKADSSWLKLNQRDRVEVPRSGAPPQASGGHTEVVVSKRQERQSEAWEPRVDSLPVCPETAYLSASTLPLADWYKSGCAKGLSA